MTDRERLSLLRTMSCGTDAVVRHTEQSLPEIYDPVEVVRLGKLHSFRMEAIEQYNVMEQVAIAALLAGDTVTAHDYIQQLASKHPASSLRLQRLQGMLLEAQGMVDDATALYSNGLERDEANIQLWKRLISTSISNGRRDDAIAALIVFLDRFMQDVEGWMQLAKLYYLECKFQQSIYCLEEVLVLRPMHPLYLVRYADVVASLGRWNTAVKYYCGALELFQDHIRALYGLRTVTALLLRRNLPSAKPKATLDADEIDGTILLQLHRLAGERLTTLYQAKGQSGAKVFAVVKSWLNQHSLKPSN